MGAFQQWLFKTSEPPALVDRALFHELQQHTAGHLETMAQEVRGLATAEDCFRLQEGLLSLIYQVEEIEDGATRRIRAGESGLDLRAEQFAAGRGARQLRTIGDALAWRVLGGDRRAVVALSQNDQPGRIFGKGQRGLQAEMAKVNEIWRAGHFALLHDVTNCLCIDDLTICARLHRDGVDHGHEGCPVDDYGLLEVKADGRNKANAEQRRRHQQALATINDGADVQARTGPRRQFLWSDGYENHERGMSSLLDQVVEGEAAAIQLEEGWVMSAVRLVTTGSESGSETVEAILREWQGRRDEAVREAGFVGRPTHHVHSGDAAGRMPRCIPYALYPMGARAFAFLTSDWLFLDSTLSIDYLDSRLRAAGLSTTRQNAEGAVIEATIGEHTIHIDRRALEDTLLEGVKIDIYAAAIAAWASQDAFAGPGEMILTLGPPVGQ